MDYIYFANEDDRFLTPPWENKLPQIPSISGVLKSCYNNRGNSSTGWWLIFEIQKNDEIVKVYFPGDFYSAGDYHYYMKQGVVLRNNFGKPDIVELPFETDEMSRAKLVAGVAAGHITMEDVPALLEFKKGNDSLFKKWKLFQQQRENEDLEKQREEITLRQTLLEKNISQDKAKITELKELRMQVEAEERALLQELERKIIFLEGESKYSHYGGDSENIISATSYQQLAETLGRFKVCKGVFVVSDGKIHRIHHAYVEEKGRAFLIGEASEYLRTKPEKVEELLEKIYGNYGYKKHF